MEELEEGNRNNCSLIIHIACHPRGNRLLWIEGIGVARISRLTEMVHFDKQIEGLKSLLLHYKGQELYRLLRLSDTPAAQVHLTYI